MTLDDVRVENLLREYGREIGAFAQAKRKHIAKAAEWLAHMEEANKSTAEGRKPLSAAELRKRRLEAVDEGIEWAISCEKMRESWRTGRP